MMMPDRGSSQASASITGKDKLFLVCVTSKIVQFPPVQVVLLLLRVVLKCAMSYFWYASVNSSIWFLLESFRGIKAPSLTPSQKQICQKDSELELIFKYVFPTLGKTKCGFQRCDISAAHALHGKQLQRDAARDNKTRPRAKAFTHIQMLLTASELGASRSGSLLSRSSKSHSFSHTMKQSDSFQIQGEYVTIGPHNGRGKRGGPGK